MRSETARTVRGARATAERTSTRQFEFCVDRSLNGQFRVDPPGCARQRLTHRSMAHEHFVHHLAADVLDLRVAFDPRAPRRTAIFHVVEEDSLERGRTAPLLSDLPVCRDADAELRL